MTTSLKVSNESNQDVTMYLTLGATPGCVHNVNDVQISGDVAITPVAALMGHFPLKAGSHHWISAPQGLGFNGNFSINTPPLNCPTPDLPDGVNLAEFIINNGFQPGGQETVDISGVCGANAYLEFRLSADDWVANTPTPVKSIRNRTAYLNTGIVGVYPFGCDNCTSSDQPPECIGIHNEYANQEPICNVQRDAANNQGGVVEVVFHGLTPIPM
jgi:hypothetical protein